MKKKSKYVGVKPLLYISLFGFAANYVHPLVTLSWIALIIYAFSGLSNKKNRYRIWQAIFASPFFEVWGRMTRAGGLPIEMGKYALTLMILLVTLTSMQGRGKKPLYHAGKLLLLVLAPSMIYAFVSVPFDYQDWVFNALGIVDIALLLLFSAAERWTEDEFLRIVKFAAYFILPIIISITLKSPKFEDTNFNSGAVGFAPNQLSTILGAGILFIFIPIALNKPLAEPLWLNYLLVIYIFFRGLLTFSRGGMLVGVFCSGILFLPVILRSKGSIIKSIMIFIVAAACGVGVFLIANKLTGNNLLKRYKGDTKGTLSGEKEKNINTATSGRFLIAETDIWIFEDYPLFGVGPGQAKEMREKYGGFNALAHVEFTRLLSEHGIGGGLAILILVFFAVSRTASVKGKTGKAIAAALFSMSILTTFHAAMRTNVPITFYVLAAMPVQYIAAASKKRRLIRINSMPGPGIEAPKL